MEVGGRGGMEEGRGIEEEARNRANESITVRNEQVYLTGGLHMQNDVGTTQLLMSGLEHTNFIPVCVSDLRIIHIHANK